ncbi:S-layer homology domain-containing protein [Bacillus salitolerans]|uniref:S-layer homology domain-containing protein n=1 Tax=Bacillus salitolerans TaxID=1437434 RepID=A0ABW4LY02_9BACI
MKKIVKGSKVILAATIAVGGIVPIGTTGYLGGIVHATETSTVPIKVVNYEKVSKDFMNHVMEGNWSEAYLSFSPELKKYVPEEFLSTLFSQVTTQFGNVTSVTSVDVHNRIPFTKTEVSVEGEVSPFSVTLFVNEEGTIEDLYIPFYYGPSNYQKPTYDTGNYVEKEVVVGEGSSFPLAGTLTMPTGEGPFPAVVLVAGSGPQDQDVTTMSLKPFRDLAVGLASQGIAVIRYDKRTYAHNLKSAMNPTLTIKEESVYDALKAVDLLSNLDEIDQDKIFVLGHSQGGMELPMIIDEDKEGKIAGSIYAAAPSSKLEDLLLFQQKQALERAIEAGLPEEVVAQQKQIVAMYEEQIALLKNPAYSKENIPQNFALGNSYWWFDLVKYSATNTAKKQSNPSLFLQGVKDIQVPATELLGWKKALMHRSDVEYKMYPDLTHPLVNFNGVPTGAEYSLPANVPANFIDDIALWVKTGTLLNLSALYSDYQDNQYWSKPVEWAVKLGVLQNYLTGDKINPNEVVSEKELLTYVFSVLFPEKLTSDVYEVAKELNIQVKGNEDALIRRGDVATTLVRAITLVEVTEGQAIQWLYDQGISTGYPNKDGDYEKTVQSFRPDDSLTRAQSLAFLYRIVTEYMNQNK